MFESMGIHNQRNPKTKFMRHHEIIPLKCFKTRHLKIAFQCFKTKAFHILNRNLNKTLGFLGSVSKFPWYKAKLLILFKTAKF